MAFLYHMDGDGTLARCWEVKDKPLLVGRGDFANASVPDSSMSRSHFLVLKESGEFFAVDLESQNGTWIEGRKISGHRLHHGDVLQAGSSLFLFSQGPTPALMAPVEVDYAQPRARVAAAQAA